MPRIPVASFFWTHRREQTPQSDAHDLKEIANEFTAIETTKRAAQMCL